MDGAILVVACTDGTMPQTKEHLLLANQVITVYIHPQNVSTQFFQPVALTNISLSPLKSRVSLYLARMSAYEIQYRS